MNRKKKLDITVKWDTLVKTMVVLLFIITIQKPIAIIF